MLLLGIFVTLVIFSTAHFIADFPLQTTYHIGKFKETKWLKPLLHHSMIHAIAMVAAASLSTTILAKLLYIESSYAVGVMYGYQLLLLIFFIDLIGHAVVDRIKASPKLGGRWTYPSKGYFIALGIDQLAHDIFSYVYVILILLNLYI